MGSGRARILLLLVIFSALGGIGAVVVVNDGVLTFVSEDVENSHSTRVLNRTGIVPPIYVGDGPATLMAFIPPRSRAIGQRDIDWYKARDQPRSQLTILRFENELRLSQVDGWLASAGPKTFVRETGWEPATAGPESWQMLVQETADLNAIVFHEQLGERTRGILIQASDTGENTRISVFDYYSARD